MALERITPTHQAIATITETIKTLKLQRDALMATLPTETKREQAQSIVHPITGKIFYLRKAK